MLVKLNGIGCCQTRELLARCVDHVKIAVRTVIPAQTDVGTDTLIVGSVHLKNRRKGKEPRESIVSLKRPKQHREISIRNRQPEAIPLLAEAECQSLVGPVGAPDASFIQRSVVVPAESLEEVDRPSPVLSRSIGKLVASPVVH